MKFDVFWRGKTTEKLNKLKNADKEQVLTAIESLMEKGSDEIKFKIKRKD